MPHALAPVVEAENDAQELELGGEQGEAQALCNDREDGGGEAEGVGGSGSGGGWGERRAQLLQLGAASWDRLVPRRVRRIFGQGIMPRAWGSQGPIFGLVDRQTTPASAWEWCVLVRWLRLISWENQSLVDTWKSRRVGRLDFLRHPLVRPVVQLPTEAFVGLLFWTSLMAFVRSVYWFMLAAQGLTSHILLLGYLLVPGLVLGHEFLHQLLSTNPVLRALLVLGGVVGVGGSREGVETTIWGVALSGAGVAMVGLYIGEGLWLAPPARRRRVGFGLAGGLLLLQALQLAFGGRNPLLARWWGLLLLAVLPGAWVAALLLYEELRDWEGEEEEGRRMVGGSGSAEGAQGYWPAGRGGQRLEGTVLSEDDWSVESEGGWRAAEEAGLKQWDSVNVLNEGGVKSGERCMEMVGDGQERAELRAANASFVAVTVERAQEEMQQQQQQMGQQQREVIPASVKAQAAEPAAARPFSTGSGCLGTSSEPNSQGWGGSVDESHDASSSAYDRSRTVSASAAAGAGGNAATGPVWVADMLGGFMEEEEEVENGGEGGTVVMSESDNDSNAGASGVACACHSPHGCECIGVLCAEGTLGGKCNSEVEERGVPVERAAVREGEGRECTGYGGKAGAEVQGNGESGRQGAAGHDSEEQIEGHGPEQQDGRCSEGTPKCNEGSLEGNEGYPEWREPARGVLGYFGLEIGSVETSEGKLRAEWRSSRQWETTVELSECDSMGYRADGRVEGYEAGNGGGRRGEGGRAEGGGGGGEGGMETVDGAGGGCEGLCVVRVRSRERKCYNACQNLPHTGQSAAWKAAASLPWEGPWDRLGSLDRAALTREDEEMLPFRQKRAHWTKHGCLRTCQAAIGHGSLMFLCHWLLSSPYLIPRWLSAPPAWGFISVVSLALGIVLAAEVLRMHIPKRVHAIVALALAVSGCIWLLLSGPFHPIPALQARHEPGSRFWLSFSQASGYVSDEPQDLVYLPGPVTGPVAGPPAAASTSQVSTSTFSEPAAVAARAAAAAEAAGFRSYLLGAPLLAMAIPSLWVVLAQNMGGAYPGLGAAGSAIWYVVLLVWSAALVAYEKLGPLGLLRGSLPVLMVVAMGGVAWGIWRAPEPKGEGRRGDLAVRTEWWRLGRLAWGSGVPDRMALLALLLILLLLLPFPLLLQYAYAPSSSPTFVSSFGSSSSSSSSTSSGSSGSAEPGSEAWVQLRVLNFNVQQGFSRAGSVNLDAIEHVIWQQKPDIVLLQESDTMHMIHGNVDMVQYLATWLGMHAWSAPPARHQSWGCAILSRFPLLSASPSQSLPSPHGELACFQHAVILLGAGNMLPGGGNMVTNRGAAGWGNQTSGVVSGYPVHIMNAHFSDLEVDIRLEAERAASLVRSVLQAGKGGEHGAGGEGEKEDKAEREERRTQEVGFPRGMGTAGELSGGLAGELPGEPSGDFNLPPLSPPYLSLLAPGLVDSEAERMGAWKSMGDRDPGAGYVFVSRGNVECEAWAEPRYDQRKTSDGYPVVVDVRVTLPAAAV
ncbi:unnamed protein product [Closterium sp. NIES-65]|nr:unnamed protein product [Closterium sp. NIES-65]